MGNVGKPRGVGKPDLEAARRLRIGLVGFALVLGCGTAGYVGFGYGILDAVFQTVVTVTTVGFGEVHPFTSGEKIFTILLILAGVGTAAYTFSVLIETFVEGQLSDFVGRRRMEQRIASLTDHVVLCGWGRVGQAIARYVVAAGQQVVVLDSDPDRIATVPHPCLLTDATEDSSLLAAGITRARVLVTALNADAQNLYVTLTGRSLCPEIFIVARASADTAIPKLLQAGANRVVNPQNIGGARMAAFAVQPHVAEFVDVVMHDGSFEFRLEEVPVPQGSRVCGETLRSARLHELTGALVLAMRDHEGAFRTNPSPEARIQPGQILIVIGTDGQIASMREALQPAT
ncbi:MAG: potassium channel family protein [Acidimicrobiales bacterium]